MRDYSNSHICCQFTFMIGFWGEMAKIPHSTQKHTNQGIGFKPVTLDDKLKIKGYF